MLKKLAALLLIALAVYWSYSSLTPSNTVETPKDSDTFSTQKALAHVEVLSQKPHYLGTTAHDTIKQYLLSELAALGFEVSIQEAYSLTEDWGSFTKPQNILARYKGSENGKALLLMSHYDSNPFSSYGASDAGSGVATILEGVRAYLSKHTPKNDLLVLFTDAEELGLNGADIFVNKHAWAKQVGLVLNFEARGSGGPSYMLIETNGGNATLVDQFIKANPEYPVANSLAYSIYKMLPNDTDLTRFREDANIDGFNFAFIDDHYDYHTALDRFDRMDVSSLKHQASYLMPLLSYFGNADLSDVKATQDLVYFNVPLFKMVSYPFSWAIPLLVLAVLLFIALVYYGIQKQHFQLKNIQRGFAAFFFVLLTNGLIGYFAWPVLQRIYPGYADILQGFPYNGHAYIIAFAVLSLAVCAAVYHRFYKPENAGSLLVAPAFFWLVLCGVLTFTLKGGSFFIVPMYFVLLSLFVLARQKAPHPVLLALLGLPALMIVAPFIQMFPVGLGLKVLVSVTLLVSLLFGLLLGVFAFYRYKNIAALAGFILAGVFFIKAHTHAAFTTEMPKPNSLVYFLDADKNQALWATYDRTPDTWTAPYFKEADTALAANPIFGSKYGSGFTQTASTYVKPLKPPHIEVKKDTLIGETRELSVFISPQRHVNRYEVYTPTGTHIKTLRVNGHVFSEGNKTFDENTRLVNYFISKDNFMELEFSIPSSAEASFDIYEISYDLLSNPLFDVPQRSSDMIPKPFVVNDAVIIKKQLHFEAKTPLEE
ncbi:MAG TPA: M28 family peptidase [Flavobacteriaceae bacterium]|nr:M28 family peptidase [Flavobacteriaceae bacterium]